MAFSYISLLIVAIVAMPIAIALTWALVRLANRAPGTTLLVLGGVPLLLLFMYLTFFTLTPRHTLVRQFVDEDLRDDVKDWVEDFQEKTPFVQFKKERDSDDDDDDDKGDDDKEDKHNQAQQSGQSTAQDDSASKATVALETSIPVIEEEPEGSLDSTPVQSESVPKPVEKAPAPAEVQLTSAALQVEDKAPDWLVDRKSWRPEGWGRVADAKSFLVISSGPFSTEEECQAAFDAQVQQEVSRHLAEYFHAPEIPQKQGNLFTKSSLKMLEVDRYHTERAHSIGTMHTVHTLLGFDESKDREVKALIASQQNRIIENRLASLGWGLVAICGLIALPWAGLKLDLATSGKRRKLLAFLTFSGIVGLLLVLAYGVLKHQTWMWFAV